MGKCLSGGFFLSESILPEQLLNRNCTKPADKTICGSYLAFDKSLPNEIPPWTIFYTFRSENVDEKS